MTEKDLEIQELRRELLKTREEAAKLRKAHAVDLSEIVRLRRMIEAQHELLSEKQI